jgi:hypothetical protein
LHGGTDKNLEVTRAPIGFKQFMTEIRVTELNLRGLTSRRGLYVHSETP